MTQLDAFRALQINQVDSAHQATIETLSVDDLRPGEVTFAVNWSGVNYKDGLAVSGKGKIMRGFPMVAGIDASGVVVESSSAEFVPGDEVLVTGAGMGEVFDGGFSEIVRAPEAAVVKLPAGLNQRDAMILGTPAVTAALAVARMLKNGQTPDMGPIAVTGPTGGVGSMAIAILAGLGFESVALTRKLDSKDYLLSIGAADVIATGDIDMGTRPLEKTRWGGAVDNVGGDLLAWLSRTIVQNGNIAAIGLVASHKLETTVMPFILRGVNLLGINSVDYPKAWRDEVWQHLSGDWKPADLDRFVTKTIGLEALPAHCDEVVAGGLTGRTLVEI